jgi:hypothetical protein
MRTMGQTNSSRFIPPLQYTIEVKNVAMSKANKIKLNNGMEVIDFTTFSSAKFFCSYVNIP